MWSFFSQFASRKQQVECRADLLRRLLGAIGFRLSKEIERPDGRAFLWVSVDVIGRGWPYAAAIVGEPLALSVPVAEGIEFSLSEAPEFAG